MRAKTQYLTAVTEYNKAQYARMNEFAFHLGFRMERSGDPLVLVLGLSDMPMFAVGSKSHHGIPREVAREPLISCGV